MMCCAKARGVMLPGEPRAIQQWPEWAQASVKRLAHCRYRL